MNDLIRMIQRHEGTGPMKSGRYLPYTDSVGKLTIGWGRNLTDLGISKEEATALLMTDIQDVYADLEKMYPWFSTLDPVRKDAVVDMAFNLGTTKGNPKFPQFKKFHAAMATHDWLAAKQHMLGSLWAKQVGSRATELAEMILTGRYQR